MSEKDTFQPNVNRVKTVFVVIKEAEQDGSEAVDSIWSDVVTATHVVLGKGAQSMYYRIDERIVDDDYYV